MAASNDLYDYITQNFGKVTILDNGFYYAQDSHGNELFVNPNDTSVSLVTLYPGSGGSGNDARAVRSLMRSDTPPGYSVIISQSSSDPYHVLDTATDILNQNGYTIESLATTGFSRSGGMVIERTADYLRRHPELASSTSIIVNDGYNNTTQCGSDLQILIDNNVPIVMIAPEESVATRTFKDGRTLGGKGLNISIMTTQDNSHMYIHDYCYYNGFPEYVLCLTDSIGNDGRVKSPEYALYKYNPDTGNYEPTTDFTGIRIQSLINLERYDYSYVKNYGQEDDEHQITYEKNSKVSGIFSDLKALGNISFSNLENSQLSDTVKSSLRYIEESVNNIRTQIKQSGFLQGVSKGNFRSSSGIPGCINGYIDAYYYIMGQLMDLITEQTEAIMSYGQAYIDMDADLKARAEELTAGTFTGNIVEEDPRRTTRPPLDGDVSEVSETPTPPETSGPGKSEDPGGTTGVAPPGTTVPTTPTTPTTPTDPTPTPPDPTGDLDLIEFERKDGSKVVAVMDGEKVKELKYVYEYKTVEEAESNLEQIKEKHKDIEYIKEVKVNENKVEAIFKEESYKDMDLDKIIEKYFVDLDEEETKGNE